MTAGDLPQEERLARLRLARTPNIGPVTFRDLIARFGSGLDAVEAVPTLAARGGRKQFRLAAPADIEREWARTEKLGAHILVLGDPAFPALMAELDPPPPALTVKGRLELMAEPAIALVGARSSSAAGMRIAQDIARDLGKAAYITVSGLARGIDTATHKGSLDTGTIACIASGLDIVYPPENANLQEAIAERGLLVSEQPLGQEPLAKYFPRRNRLISGFSLGVVVIEAALRSGSLITARFALEQNREVFAVPGSPLDQRARGCNRLIKQGATLVENANDILEALGAPTQHRLPFREPDPTWDNAPLGTTPGDEDDAAREAVLTALSPTPTEVDVLARHTGLPLATVRSALLELDLAGRLARDGARRVSLLPEG